MQSLDVLEETTREFLRQIAALLPRLALALGIILVGWLIAKAVRFAVEKGLRAVNFNVLTERAGTDHFLQQGGLRGDTTTLFGLFAYWLVILAALISACDKVGLTYITDLLHRIVLFAPKVLVAMLVAIFGSYFARFVGSAVSTYCVEAQHPGCGPAWQDRPVSHHGLRDHDRAESGGGRWRHRAAHVPGDLGRHRAGARIGIRTRRQGLGGLASGALVAEAEKRRRDRGGPTARTTLMPA